MQVRGMDMKKKPTAGQRIIKSVQSVRSDGVIVHSFASHKAGDREVITQFDNGVKNPIVRIRRIGGQKGR
jgi:hypothetical protein